MSQLAKRCYFDNRTTYWGAHLMPPCEHCDGEHDDNHVRNDDLRGWVCEHCDSAIDAMLRLAR